MLLLSYSYGDEIHFGSRKLLGTMVIFSLRILDLCPPSTTPHPPSSGMSCYAI
jgi:hypothetical protein